MKTPVHALLALSLLAAGCGTSKQGGGQRQFFVAFSQCNNAEPYRAAQNAMMAACSERSRMCNW